MSDLADKIRDCAARGLSQKQTAAELGRDKALICRVQKREGIVLRRETCPVRLKVPEAAYRLCADGGLTPAQTARKLGVAHSTVRAAAKRHGLKFVPGKRGRPAKPYP